ncbi:glycerophosphodiester phosphodiesterase family protein [Sphaerisporangium sp. NPDC051011]|uniref:glycerophosphodiester phosphodiesterase family protein n=1 Tax=Sphaerisporangium sp. NPDC051011 TaxID=3155792 RepID=UPI003411E330
MIRSRTLATAAVLAGLLVPAAQGAALADPATPPTGVPQDAAPLAGDQGDQGRQGEQGDRDEQGEQGRHGGRKRFDLQAHRGGLGLVVESTLDSFANGLRVGVSTLELDIQITEDGRAVVTHDRKVDGRKCQDTGPVTPGDPEYPYVGKYINTLTLAQVRTLDCGSRTLPDFPAQRPAPGARMPLLSEVFDLVKKFRAHDVKLNVETKVEAGAPAETAPREQFVQVAVKEIRRAHIERQVTIQSFDWGALMRMRQVEPRLPLVALTNYDFLQTGKPGASPWLGGIDIDDFGGDPLKAIKSFGASAFSPVHGFPQNGKVTDPTYVPYVTKAMVDQAHRMGIKVVPWTIDDEPTMNKLIDDGVDGIITDYPDRLRGVLAARGYELPRQYPGPRH